MPSFDNTEIAFKGKSNRELEQSYFLFRLIGKPWLVKIGARLSGMAFKLKLPIKKLIKKTIFKQFCGGENIRECDSKVNELSQFGIGAILDYSVEGKNTEEELDANCSEIILTIQRAANDPKKIPFAVFKPTGIARVELLEKINSDHTLLSREEDEEAERYFERMDRICKTAYENNISVFVDAEDSWIQDGIDRNVEVMMQRYNQKKAIVFCTLQMYRHDRINYLKQLSAKAKEKNFHAGVKLVRGAYMEKERKRAFDLGYPSPIQPTKESTDRDFNLAIEFILSNINHFALCCGTHNEESNNLLIELLEKHHIDRNDNRIFSAQLLGMSDHISYTLAHNGYNVVKYVPYGPIKEVMPYLIRRAEENTSVAGQTGRELSLIKKEKLRRKNFPVLYQA